MVDEVKSGLVVRGDAFMGHHVRPRGLALVPGILRYLAIYRRFRTATLLARDAYIANLYLIDWTLADPRLSSGCIVECGTWRGGMAAGLATIGGAQHDYYFFDSFAGLPAAGDEDGAEAKRWQATRDGRPDHDNCFASRTEFDQTMNAVHIPAERIHVFEGLFEDSFRIAKVLPIAILRLDADWYSSTMLCLETFWERLLPRALVIIDDYYAWEGCRKAVHAFLARRQASEALRQSRYGKVVYLLKD
jgi:O-methyltransferase